MLHDKNKLELSIRPHWMLKSNHENVKVTYSHLVFEISNLQYDDCMFYINILTFLYALQTIFEAVRRYKESTPKQAFWTHQHMLFICGSKRKLLSDKSALYVYCKKKNLFEPTFKSSPCHEEWSVFVSRKIIVK